MIMAGRTGGITYGQKSNCCARRLAKKNLATRGIDGQIAHGDTFHCGRTTTSGPAIIRTNPLFNVSVSGSEHPRDDEY